MKSENLAPSVPSKEEPRRRDVVAYWDSLTKGELWRLEQGDVNNLVDEACEEIERLRTIADPVIAFVAARERNDDAEPCDWSARAAEVDGAWHALKEAAETLQGVTGRSTEPGDSGGQQ